MNSSAARRKAPFGLKHRGRIIVVRLMKSGGVFEDVSLLQEDLFLMLQEKYYDTFPEHRGLGWLPDAESLKQRENALSVLKEWLRLCELDTTRLH